MPSYTTQDIRNIALVGNGGSGKTSLAEALLVAGGALHQPGLVEKGTTASDFTDEEKSRGHSLYSAVLHCDYEGKRINLIDTPGYGDFSGQALGALNAVETAVVVVNAATGVEPTTRKMMERAQEMQLDRIIVINKIDGDNLDLPTLVSQVQQTFGAGCLPINLPTGGGAGVIDVFANTVGESDFGSVADAHTAIVEQVVEMDEAMMEKYLEQGEVSPDELHDVFEKALAEAHLIPICFTCARHHADPTRSVGVKELLAVIAKLAPSPMEGNPRVFAQNGDETTVQPDAGKPLIAHAFKVSIDRFGKTGAFRVHQGQVTKDTSVHIGGAKKPVKIGHLYTLQGKDHKETDAAIAGDICAVVKVDDLHYDAVLHEGGNGDLKLKAPPLPQPMYGLAITAKKHGEEGKIVDALHKIAEEDPTFKRVIDSSTKEMVIYGMGEQHLRVLLEKMKSRYNIEVDTHPPKIAYRETILAKAEGHHRHKKQTGGAGQFGEVFLRVEPMERGAGFEFVNDIFGGAIPGQYIPAIEKGVKQALADGVIAGFPVQDVRVSVYDGKHHPVDSKEVAFVTAGKRAFIDGFMKAKPVLLEPVVNLEVTVPNANMGDITGDLSGRRGRIQGTDMLPGDLSVIMAQVPLAEVANYQNQLKSVTGGQGSYTMELSHYEPVPPNVQQQVVSQFKRKEDED